MLFALCLSIWIVTLSVCTIRQHKCKINLQSRLNFDNMLTPLVFRLSACCPSGFLCVHLISHIESHQLKMRALSGKISQNLINLNVKLNFTCMIFPKFLLSDMFSIWMLNLFSCAWKCSFMARFQYIFAYLNCQACQVVIKQHHQLIVYWKNPAY